jgi:hypothetical protein
MPWEGLVSTQFLRVAGEPALSASNGPALSASNGPALSASNGLARRIPVHNAKPARRRTSFPATAHADASPCIHVCVPFAGIAVLFRLCI